MRRKVDRPDVILLAAGKGLRSELPYSKTLFRVGGKPIIIWAAEAILNNMAYSKLVVVVDNELLYSDLFADYSIEATIVLGGNTRQESVYKGLSEVCAERVLIHEAARPFITGRMIQDLLISSLTHEVVVPVLGITDTVYDRIKGRYIDRSTLYRIQVPQMFNTQLLRKAHSIAKYRGENNFTDDSSLVSKLLDAEINFIEGSEENIKITTPTDLVYAEGLYIGQHSNSRR